MKKILMASACMLSATYAAFADVDTSTLTAARGFSVIGKTANDNLGHTVTSAGDFNNDKKDDLLITNLKSKAYIVFGKGSAQANAIFDLADATKTTTDFITLTTNAPNAPLVGALAGDINADGIDDVVIGLDDGASGQVFVVYGKTSPADLNVDTAFGSAPTANGFMLQGPNNKVGFAVAAAGDFNGDGKDDIIVSSEWMVRVIFGKKTSDRNASPNYGDPVNSNGGDGFIILNPTSPEFGASIAGIGDVNGDGKDDILIGAPGENKAYIIYGSNPTTLVNMDFSSNVNPPQFAVISGVSSPASKFGKSVALAGDFNHDGKDDIMIAAPEFSSTQEGRVYVIFGQPAKADLDDITDITTLGTKGLTITGAAANNKLGYSIAGINDINDDGVDDIAVTAEGTPKAYVLFGKKGIADSIVLSATLASTSGVTISGPASSMFGKCVRAVGDINADGVNDFAISAPGYVYTAGSRNSAGAAYIIYGVGEPVTGFISIDTKSSFRLGASISMIVSFMIALML